MNIYLSRSFKRANVSFRLCSGNAVQSTVSRLGEEMFLVDEAPAKTISCMQDEIQILQINRENRFENKVGYKHRVVGESMSKKQILERFFIDLVVGESMSKERAAERVNDLVGYTERVAGQTMILPRRFRKNRAWMELNKIWKTNQKVKGFIIEKAKGGYSVAIAGFITFLPFRTLIRKRIANDRFNIESIKEKRMNIVVF